MKIYTLKKTILALISRLGLILFGIVIALIGLEVFFRLLYPDPSPKLNNQALQVHKTYGIAFTPNTEGWNTSLRGEYSVYITINNKGLRGKEYPYQKTKNTFRILTLGDSFTAALQVKEDQLFSTLLEKQLNETNKNTQLNIDVINAGVVGYGTTNQLAYFVEEGYKYNPDIVLLMFFAGNDILDNINPPHYTLKDGHLKPIEFVYNPTIGTPPWAKKGSPFRNFRNYLYTHSRLYSVVVEILVYSLIQQSPQLATWVQTMGFVEIARPLVNAGNIYSFLQPPEEAWQMSEALIVALNQAVKSKGSDLVVVIIPDETEVDDKKWQTLFTNYPDLFKSTNLKEKPTAKLAKILNQHNIPYLQLQPTFKTHYNTNKTPLYLKYDGHWTAQAHELTTKALYEYLINNYLSSK